MVSFVDASLNYKMGHTGFVIGIMRPTQPPHPQPDDPALESVQFFPLFWKSIKQGGTVYSSMAAELNALHRCSMTMLHLHRLLDEMSLNLPMAIYTDSKNSNDQLESSSHPWDLDLIPSLQHYRTRLTTNNICNIHCLGSIK